MTGKATVSARPSNDEIASELRAIFPHGHPTFTDISVAELDLHSRKNYDYAHGGDPLGNFRRVASICSQYPNLRLSDPAVVAMVYALKQVDAYLWSKSAGHQLKTEGVKGRLNDISVYARIVNVIEQESSQNIPRRTEQSLSRS